MPAPELDAPRRSTSADMSINNNAPRPITSTHRRPLKWRGQYHVLVAVKYLKLNAHLAN